MMDTLAELAERQWRDYRAREPGTCFANTDFVLNLAQAYEIQQAVSALRIAAGDCVIGYKVGCTGSGTVGQFGIEGPIRGILYKSEIHQTGDELDMAAFAHLAIEGEMALRIGEDGQIAAAFPVIELHHFVFRAPHKTLVELVANNGLNAGIVLPEEPWLSSRTYLEKRAQLSIRVNGSVISSGNLWPHPGGPIASLDWLRRHLIEFNLTLVPGQFVLAGTPLDLYPVGSGDHIAVFIDDELITQCSVA